VEGPSRLRIGQVAERVGVNIQTLRYYERRGLLEPERRHSGHRTYGLDDVQFVRSIRTAQSLGFTLAEIEEILELTRRHGTAAGELGSSAADKIRGIDRKITQLQAMRASLQMVIDLECDSLTDCSCGPACPVGPNEGLE
jgi:DNA-binding transcriptional MerR regulator